MRLTLFLALMLASAGCEGQPATPASSASPAVPDAANRAKTSPPNAATAIAFPLRIEGAGFVDRDGQPFRWRGITAFRLAEFVAHGRESEAAAYLDWAASQQLTVVRVLLMAQHLFELSAEDGRRALPRLLDLAKERGIAVEAVAFADTKDRPLDHDAHIREIGRIAMEKGNALIEIANEPGHPTQDARLHDPAFAQRLAALLPETLLVALGSFEYGEGYAAGDYATTHVPRGAREWDHVLAIADGAERASRLAKPVVSDEPIGAGPEYQPGRRDNDPARFAAAAALTRLAGMHATFHYESGLQARVPVDGEADCLAAWRRGLGLIEDHSATGEFVRGTAVASIARVEGARASFARVSAAGALLLLIDPGPSAAVKWADGWREVRRSAVPGVQLIAAERVGRR